MFPVYRDRRVISLQYIAADGTKRFLKGGSVHGAEVKDLYTAAGRAKAKAGSRDFIAGALAFFSDRVLVFPSISWNTTREAIPTLTKVLDFSGPELVARPARADEFFRDPAPCTAEDILSAPEPAGFLDFVAALFDDHDTRRTALECYAACVSGVAKKTVQIWNNREGDGAKNTSFDLLSRLVPGRIVMGKNALILYRGDSSERRFGEAIMQGKTAVGFDKPCGAFDVAQIKRYASLSVIRAEAKGKESVEFVQTWSLFFMVNQLPRFFPADDTAFLSRILVLPFSSVFYRDKADKRRRLAEGIAEDRLRPAIDKDVLLSKLLEERPGILGLLARIWIGIRKSGGNIFESAECVKAREAYRADNDLTERFFAEYLKRDEHGSVEYSTLKSAWSESTGDTRPAMREVVALLTKRFPFLVAGKSNGSRVLKGASFRTEYDPEPDAERDARDAKHDFPVRETKNQNSTYKVENAALRPLRPSEAEETSDEDLPFPIRTEDAHA